MQQSYFWPYNNSVTNKTGMLSYRKRYYSNTKRDYTTINQGNRHAVTPTKHTYAIYIKGEPDVLGRIIQYFASTRHHSPLYICSFKGNEHWLNCVCSQLHNQAWPSDWAHATTGQLAKFQP